MNIHPSQQTTTTTKMRNDTSAMVFRDDRLSNGGGDIAENPGLAYTTARRIRNRGFYSSE